jgi:diguanylate cyclase (GGDEF)-like protein
MNFELLKSITILYVEDEISLQNDICQNIEPFVNKIIRANDGQEGVALFLDNRDEIDLIVSDILMPKMNGIEMISAIREYDADIPVIFTTAFNDSKYMKETIELSIISYILKPIDVEMLLKSIEKASFKVENERLKKALSEMNRGLEVQVAQKTEALKIQNEKLYNQVYTDDITNLLNRKALLRDINLTNNPVVSIVDIDDFKHINDTYGEEVGNITLLNVGKLLKEAGLKNGCNVYRIGSDEFALLKDKEFEIEQCKKTISGVMDAISKNKIYIEKYDISLRIDTTVGISKEKTNTIETAGMALKIAKNEKLGFQIYSNKCSLYEEYKNDMLWTRIIEKAIKDDMVVPYYQPIVDKNRNIVKYEALIRIVENDNIYLPHKFLKIAKKVKFYALMEKLMISKVLKKAKDTGVRININLSIEDIFNDDLIDFIEEQLKSSSIAHLITFELLENRNIIKHAQAIEFVENMKNVGCSIAIDDFGSGYSNFNYLLKIKPNYIKIDGSSVKDIENDTNSHLITKTINDFAHSLGIKTVAEFVHNEEIFNILKDIGIDEYQGYYFSKPLKDF